MVGIGEQYFSAFVLALGHGPVAAGWVTTLPQIIGGVAQTGSSRTIHLAGSTKRWVVFTAALQACAFAPMIAGALLGELPLSVVFAMATLYYGAGMACGAAWSTLIGAIVPERIRAGFFGVRQRLLQIGTLVGYLAGALILSTATGNKSLKEIADPSTVLPLFAVLFGVALLCRTFSTTMLARHTDPRGDTRPHRRVPLLRVVRGLLAADGGRAMRVLAYMFAITIAANLSGPFCVPYLLDQLKFSYLETAALVGTVMLAKALALSTLTGWAKRYGPGRLLLIGGIGVVPTAILWTCSSNFFWLLAAQAYAGLAWACYDLASFLLLLRHTHEEERTSLWTTWNFLSACAIATGAFLGGTFLKLLAGGTEIPQSAYLWLFAASSLLRLGTLPWLWRAAR